MCSHTHARTQTRTHIYMYYVLEGSWSAWPKATHLPFWNFQWFWSASIISTNTLYCLLGSSPVRLYCNAGNMRLYGQKRNSQSFCRQMYQHIALINVISYKGTVSVEIMRWYPLVVVQPTVSKGWGKRMYTMDTAATPRLHQNKPICLYVYSWFSISMLMGETQSSSRPVKSNYVANLWRLRLNVIQVEEKNTARNNN